MRNLFKSTCFLFSMLAGYPTPSYGQFSIDVTVGLDQPTKQLVQQFLPQNIRVELLKTLDAALPKLKESLDAYLAEVNSSIERQILNGQCAGEGLAAEFKQQFKGLVGHTPGPIQDFRSDEKKALESLTFASDAQKYLDVYGDLYHKSAVAYCQMQISGAVERAVEIEDQYRELFFMWERVKKSCDSASDCTNKLLQRTQEIIASSDPQDVLYVGATEKLAHIVVPAAPSRYERAKQSISLSAFAPKPYEDAIRDMLRIQDHLRLAKFRREYVAADAVKTAGLEILILQNTTQEAREACEDNQRENAQRLFNSAADLYARISSDLTNAKRLDPTNQAKKVGLLEPDLKTSSAEIDSIHSCIETLEP